MGELREGQTDTPAPPHAPPTREQQYRNEVREMARAALNAGNAIIAENRLSTTPSGVNLAWILTGENSLAAQYLAKAAADGDAGSPSGRISVPLEVNDQILGMDVPHDLTKAFVIKMGFPIPQTREEWLRQYDDRRHVVVFSDPEKPFIVEGHENGKSKEGEPRLEGFSLVAKTPRPNVG